MQCSSAIWGQGNWVIWRGNSVATLDRLHCTNINKTGKMEAMVCGGHDGYTNAINIHTLLQNTQYTYSAPLLYVPTAAELTIVSSSSTASSMHSSLPRLQVAIFPHTILRWVCSKGSDKVRINPMAIPTSQAACSKWTTEARHQ